MANILNLCAEEKRTREAKKDGTLHCLPLEAILEDSTNFYIISRRLEGGELFDFLAKEDDVSIPVIQRLIRHILLGLKQLHDHNIVHRDIKPENIMFESSETDSRKLMLIDFDLCEPWTPHSPGSDKVVGTPGYIAPECLLGDFSPLSDIWSVGVVFYVVMVGGLPYNVELTLQTDGCAGSPRSKEAHRRICEQKVDWDSYPWPEFPDAKDLCQKLLDVSPTKRIQSVDAALEHPFFNV